MLTAWAVSNPEKVTRVSVYSEMKKEAFLRVWDPLCFEFAILWPHDLSLFKMSTLTVLGYIKGTDK